jgi:hypothetical protein
MGDSMNKLFNVMVILLTIIAGNLCAMDVEMDADREGVITPGHTEEIRRAEEDRQRQAMYQQLRQDREQARARAHQENQAQQAGQARARRRLFGD